MRILPFDNYYNQLILETEYEGKELLERIINSKTIEEAERIISTVSHLSYEYATLILKDRFELGEKEIATSSWYSFYYALKVLNGTRVPIIEKTIAESAQYSFSYARDCLKGRFELGEPEIATDSLLSLYYAFQIMKGRFELGEKEICDHPDRSMRYIDMLQNKKIPVPDIFKAKYHTYIK